MPTPQDLEKKFWKSLNSDMTVMLGLCHNDNAGLRPMTAQLDDKQEGPIYFFTSKETTLAQAQPQNDRAVISFASKNHDVFANVDGTLSIDTDRALIDRLWNPFVAAWFEKGKDDPKLCLLRFDPEQAEIWENGSSLIAGLKILLGSDPKEDYKDKVAKVAL